MYTSLLMAASVAVIAAIRQRSWSADTMPWIALAAATIAFIGGQYLDGVSPSLDVAYLRTFVLAIAGQQALHRMVQGTTWFQAIEAAGGGPVAELPLVDRQATP